MSLLSELEARGVTAEDLEKAASVRYFEKAAAAEGVNLDELDEGQVEELYASFIHNRASAVDDHSKEASAMNPDIIDLFEKTAAAEGIDLGEMDDAELAELYNHYVENVLPEQIGGEKEASDDEAYEKLAEAEILGRHMARAYMDELDKEAAVSEIEGRFRAIKDLKARGMSTAEAKAQVDGFLNSGATAPKSRELEIRAAKKRIRQKAKNPRGTQAPARQSNGIAALGKTERQLAQTNAGPKRVKETRDAAKAYLSGKYNAGRAAVGKRQIQLGRVLGGTTRSSARLRGGLAMGGAGLAAAGGLAAGVGAMRKESSYGDLGYMVEAFEDILLDKVAGYDDEDSVEDVALEIALENLYDAGYDLSEI
jgi:hypothetical protein